MINVRNIVVGLIVSVLVPGVMVACGGGGGGGGGAPAAATKVARSSSMDGPQANLPLVVGTGRGGVIVTPTSDPDKFDISGGINFKDLTGAPVANPGGAHIHNSAIAGDPIIIALIVNADNATATVPAGSQLTAAQYAALLANQLYFQVHTGANPGGEIRGTISGTTGLVVGTATLNGAQVAPTPVTTTAIGKGTIIVDSSTRQILTAYCTHNVTGATSASIIPAVGPGTTGATPSVALNLGTNSATASQGASMTQQDYDNLLLNYSYFIVASGTNPNGEIRGDIAIQAMQ